MTRFFLHPDTFDEASGHIDLLGDDAKHIAVIRGQIGDKIIVCNGEGIDYHCVISDISKRQVRLAITDKQPSLGEPRFRITLFQGLPKNDKMEHIIQKSVELGVYNIVPVQTAFAVVKLDGKVALAKTARWQKIAESAAKQCGRGMVPRVCGPVPLREAVTLAKRLDDAYAAYEKEEARLLSACVAQSSGHNIGIFIGPEGGFSKDEADLFAHHGILPVSLGRRILRTETAGFAAIMTCLIVNGEI